MKKSLALLTVAMLLVGTSGCGTCRGLFRKKSRPLATPLYSQCAPSCAPTCSTGGSCGTTGTPVMYGYGGAIATESMPMTIPAGSGTYGQ
ncbi:MAG: hypothetical protein GXP24_15110 [Planctomycetes bacterium]|nr:hypothetical protein [Planctomycetota bacterium]